MYGGGIKKFPVYQTELPKINWSHPDTPISFDIETIEVEPSMSLLTPFTDEAFNAVKNIEEAMALAPSISWGKNYKGHTHIQRQLQQHYAQLQIAPVGDPAHSRLTEIAKERINEYFMQNLKEHSTPQYEGEERPVYRTQKAKGLKSPYGSTLPQSVHTPTYNVFPYELPTYIENGLFARPAPMRPRHGFVESRDVKTWADILAVYLEALEQDPEAEIILMEKINGNYSAVATNAGVSWGRGNDGATAGNGSVFLPAPLGIDTWNKKVAGLYPEKVGIKHCAYMELVEGYGGVYLVQRRDGPEPPVTLDYVPKDMTIETIIKEDGINLLAWEQQIKSYTPKQIKGMVFDNRGGTLASHYAVHAIEHGIAVICDAKRTLTVGAKLAAFSERPSLTDKDYLVLKKRVKHWWHREFDLEDDSVMRDQVRTIVGSIHTMSSAWDARPELLELRAMAVTSLARLLTAASFGELRHWNDVGPGNRYDRTTGGYKETCHEPETKTPGVKSSGRKSAWRKVIHPMSFNEAKKLNKLMGQDFAHCGWNTGFGGENWANIANHNYELIRAIQHFMNHPRETTWSALVVSANKALHTVHNGGVALSKWVDSTQLDTIASVPVYGFTNAFTAKLVMESAGK